MDLRDKGSEGDPDGTKAPQVRFVPYEVHHRPIVGDTEWIFVGVALGLLIAWYVWKEPAA